MLIHFDPPVKKEHYTRRMGLVGHLGAPSSISGENLPPSQGQGQGSSSSVGPSVGAGEGAISAPRAGPGLRCVAVHFVVAGEVGAFRSVEGWAVGGIEPLPIRAADMFV